MFSSPYDIANRALQYCGVSRISTFSDNSKAAAETSFIYDKVRRAELRRNLWVFATRRVALRALDTTSSLLTFEAYSSGKTYPAGYIVTSGNQTWVSLIGGNLGNTPGTPAAAGYLPWDIYFGPVVANAWNDTFENSNVATSNTSYHMGELVYLFSTGNIYVSLVEGNQNEPDTVDTWSNEIMYAVGAVVSYNGVNYQSLVARNFNFEPDTSPTQWTTTVTNPTVSGSWVQLTGASLNPAPIVYPLTAGPSSDLTTQNAFMLPAGFLRPAPQSPKAGVNAWLGAHVGSPANDWTYEGRYLVTRQYTTALVLRFIADVTDVATFDDMFCEGLACRIALGVAETLTQSPPKAQLISAEYAKFMFDARAVDAIESGPVEQTEDEYITVRY